MPTTKTISHIGDTKFEVIKDTYDAFKFTVDDKSASPNSPKTVMYISSEAATAAVPTPLSTTGRITMSNTRTEGATSTSSADVDHDVGIGGKILIREGTGAGTATRAAIYAEKDATANNHRLIIDPYKEDDADNSDSTNNGTVYIRGNLIVEGDKTILDTAEHITSENLLGINAVKDSSGNTTGGAATTAGIHVYSGSTDTQFLYNFGTSRWRTARTNQTLKDLEAKDVFAEKLTATGTSHLSAVDINGGNIDGTIIGASVAAAATFTALTATGTSTLTNVDINGGNIDGTAIGDTVAATAKFTTLDASGAVNFASTLGVTGALSGTSGSFSGNVTAATFTGNLTGSVTGTPSSPSTSSQEGWRLETA